MVVLATCKNEENQIKNEGASVVTTLTIYQFLRCPRAANFIIGNGIWPKFKLYGCPCYFENEEVLLKNEGT